MTESDAYKMLLGGFREALSISQRVVEFDGEWLAVGYSDRSRNIATAQFQRKRKDVPLAYEPQRARIRELA